VTVKAEPGTPGDLAAPSEQRRPPAPFLRRFWTRAATRLRNDGGKAVEDPDLDDFVRRAREAAGNPAAVEASDEQIVQMLIFGVVNESCRALEEGVVIRASDIDVAIILGMGFPAYRGGPMKWADAIGARTVHERLLGWHERFGVELFRPSEYLAKKARDGGSLLG